MKSIISRSGDGQHYWLQIPNVRSMDADVYGTVNSEIQINSSILLVQFRLIYTRSTTSLFHGSALQLTLTATHLSVQHPVVIRVVQLERH